MLVLPVPVHQYTERLSTIRILHRLRLARAFQPLDHSLLLRPTRNPCQSAAEGLWGKIFSN